MRRNTWLQAGSRVALVALLVCALGACNYGDFAEHHDATPDAPSAPAVAATSPNRIQPGDGGERGLNVSLLNYTDEGVDVVYVDGEWAGGMGAHGGGTSIAGGAGVPAKWRKDYQLRISWMTDSMYFKDHSKLKSRMVPVEPYGPNDGGFLWVAFFPNDVIKLYVSSYGPGHPHWPGGLDPPAVQCWLDGFTDCQEVTRPSDMKADGTRVPKRTKP